VIGPGDGVAGREPGAAAGGDQRVGQISDQVRRVDATQRKKPHAARCFIQQSILLMGNAPLGLMVLLVLSKSQAFSLGFRVLALQANRLCP